MLRLSGGESGGCGDVTGGWRESVEGRADGEGDGRVEGGRRSRGEAMVDILGDGCRVEVPLWLARRNGTATCSVVGRCDGLRPLRARWAERWEMSASRGFSADRPPNLLLPASGSHDLDLDLDHS